MVILFVIVFVIAPEMMVPTIGGMENGTPRRDSTIRKVSQCA
jgi:hypothetical protein